MSLSGVLLVEPGCTISKHPSYVTDGRKPFKNQLFFALTDQFIMNDLYVHGCFLLEAVTYVAK